MELCLPGTFKLHTEVLCFAWIQQSAAKRFGEALPLDKIALPIRGEPQKARGTMFVNMV